MNEFCVTDAEFPFSVMQGYNMIVSLLALIIEKNVVKSKYKIRLQKSFSSIVQMMQSWWVWVEDLRPLKIGVQCMIFHGYL